MEHLVRTLAVQHRALVAEIENLERALAAKDVAAVRGGLETVQRLASVHFELETKEFYPPFLERALTDVAAHRMVSMFHANFVRIADGSLAFFKRWEGPFGEEKLPALASEWETVNRALLGRMRDEDTILHPVFRRLFAI